MNINDVSTERNEEDNKLINYAGLFLKNCQDMVFIFNDHLCLIACSETCLPLLGSGESADFVHLPLQAIFSSNLGYAWIQKIYQQNGEVLRILESLQFDETITLRGENYMHAHVVISPLLDDSGECHGTMMTISNITELIETKRSAEEAARSKSSFLANMSHEIRTPMNAVKGLSELLALTDLSNLQRNYVKNIISSANSLLGIINDVLDFSKIDANRIELIKSSYDLGGLITGVCSVVSVRADDKKLLLLIDAAADLPTTLIGDDMRIKQVLTNLLSNAVKYTNEGFVRLGVHAEERGCETWLCFEVEDSGVGIRQEDIPILFDAFYRADLLTHRSIAGTGLGLAIAKQLALAMGGNIQVESVYGRGSIFTFSIPQDVADPQPIAHVENVQSKSVLLLGADEYMQSLITMLEALGVPYTYVRTADALDGVTLYGYSHCISDGNFSERVIRLLCDRMPECLFATLKNMRLAMSISDYQDTVLFLPVFIAELARFLNKDIRDTKSTSLAKPSADEFSLHDVKALIVDDNEINLIVGSEMLRSFGAEVICAESGDEALRLCEEQKYDIIFMDHMMPGKDGIETTRELRQGKGLNSETPIIALTANVVNDMESVYLRSGMDGFIGKPVELSTIGEMLRKWLPPEKTEMRSTIINFDTGEVRSEILSPQELIAAMDNFGLYASDVMREVNGDFDGYITRMEEASWVLDALVTKLKAEADEKDWNNFSRDCLELHYLLYGIGARDCAARARKMAIAAREGNLTYIDEDFGSLMGNMYMLDKKLVVIVPFARNDNTQDLPLGSSHFLLGCLKKMGCALEDNDESEALMLLDKAAAFSLDMDLDMALKAIKTDLEKRDFAAAVEYHSAILRVYTERLMPANS